MRLMQHIKKYWMEYLLGAAFIIALCHFEQFHRSNLLYEWAVGASGVLIIKIFEYRKRKR